jgi:superfamily I DNA/RNA helicase
VLQSRVRAALPHQYDRHDYRSIADAYFSPIEEERRLLYVAMTRAKDVLELMTPCRGYVPRDNSSFSSPTRFIPTKLYRLFKRTTGHRSSDGTDTRIA